MTLRAPDRTRDTSTTTGTGPFTLSGTGVAGYRTFAQAITDSHLANADTFSGFIWNETVPAEFVWGIFTYSTTGPTVTVTTVKGGSNGASAVTFSAGTKHVVSAPISDMATWKDWLGYLANLSEDTTPQLSGDLDVLSKGFTNSTGAEFLFSDAGEPYVVLYNTDDIADFATAGGFKVDSTNASAGRFNAGGFYVGIVDDTASSETAFTQVQAAVSGEFAYIVLGDVDGIGMYAGITGGGYFDFMDFSSQSFRLHASGTDVTAALERDDTHGSAVNVAGFSFTGRSSTGTARLYGDVTTVCFDDTNAGEDGYVKTSAIVAGSTTEILRAGSFGGVSNVRFPSILAKPVLGTDANGDLVPPSVVTLADGATPALDASLGSTFELTAAGNRTIGIPSNPTAGQKIVIRHIASGGSRTLALNSGTGGFRFGTDITTLTATASGLTDYIGCIYNLGANKWDVVSVIKGF